MPAPRRVILASTSRYRRALLERLGFPFECADPKTDEAPLKGEAPGRTALRLAEAKARAAAHKFADALVIGSDQVATGTLAYPSLFFVGLLLFAITLGLNLISEAFVRRVRQRY